MLSLRIRPPYTPALIRVGRARVSTEGCPCTDESAEVFAALNMPHAARMHAAGDGVEWPLGDWLPHLEEEEAPGKFFDALKAVAATLPDAEREGVLGEVDFLLDEHAVIRQGIVEGCGPDQRVADSHGAKENNLVGHYKPQLLAYAKHAKRMSAGPKVGSVRVGVDEEEVIRAKASLDASKADAEAQLDSIKRISADVKASLGPDGKPSGGGSLDTALDRANERDEEGHKQARASLIKIGSTIGGGLLYAFPPAAIAWAAATAIALGMMEALNEIGLDKLRIGRSRDAYTQEWLDRAHADQERLRGAGFPFPMYNEGQHVSPREYAADYLEAQNIAPIDALRPADRDLLNEMGSAIARQREVDPVVIYLYAKMLIPSMGWVYYAHATTEAPLLTYASMGVEPGDMLDLIAMAAMRDANANAAYFDDIRGSAESGWNLGIALATAGSGAFKYGRGARAAAQAWRFAIDKARAHAATGRTKAGWFSLTPISADIAASTFTMSPEFIASQSESSSLPILGLGALVSGGLYLAGVATGIAVVPAIAAVLYAVVKK